MINLLFSGDFAPCRNFESVVLEKKAQVLGDALPLIEAADLSFTNLECPLTTHNHTINKSGPALKANPACVEALKPFSVVCLANNHILDYGRQGLADTLAACNEAGLPTIGAGMDLKQAQQPFIQEVKGIKIAIIAIAEHEFNQSENAGAGSAPIDPIDNYQQIQLVKTKADIVIVTLHGGNEYFPYPRPGLRKLCQHYIDLGVEAVICHHPHVPGAYEYYQGKPIVYSLGNFIFDAINPPKDWELGYMAQLSFSSETKKFKSMELTPYKQSVELGGIQLLKNQEKNDFLAKIETYRQNMENHQAWLKAWDDFVAKQADSYILRQFFPMTFRGLGLLARNTPIAKLFFNKANSLPKLNMLRCQSHRELLTAVLETKSQPRND
jgi:poly-gamma-glutamate synthesis protein (capsule biosynthesis protein)